MNCHILEIHNYKITSRALSFGGGPLGSSRVVKRVVGAIFNHQFWIVLGHSFWGFELTALVLESHIFQQLLLKPLPPAQPDRRRHCGAIGAAGGGGPETQRFLFGQNFYYLLGNHHDSFYHFFLCL